MRQRSRATALWLGLALGGVGSLPPLQAGALKDSGAQGPRVARTQTPAPASVASAVSTPRALLDTYCISCHNEKLRTAGLLLDQLDVAQVGAHAEVWEKVLRKLRSGMMPPPGR